MPARPRSSGSVRAVRCGRPRRTAPRLAGTAPGLRVALGGALLLLAVASPAAGAEDDSDPAVPPTDNPVASYYGRDAGWPAWTERIAWERVIDMSRYDRGTTDFERFENARDELAAGGGGVLWYPAGTYDFTEGPFDGPNGRGLLLPEGVVIRGQAPSGHPRATEGPLALRTRFVFGFRRRDEAAVETGQRAALALEDALRSGRDGRDRTDLRVGLAAPGGEIRSAGATFTPRGFGAEVRGRIAAVERTDDGLRLRIGLDVRPATGGARAPLAGRAELTAELRPRPDGDGWTGTFRGTHAGEAVGGDLRGDTFTARAETPRDWNLIGLLPPPDGGISRVDLVGICWVHLVGSTVWFGPELDWGSTWGEAGSWKSAWAKGGWKERVPDGTHPWDPLAGGGTEYRGAGEGRLVFGCVLEDSVGVNDAVTMGRADTPDGFGADGFSTAKFTPRIGLYGARVLVANCLVPRSVGRNFLHRQLTRRTFPRGGNGIGLGEESVRPVLFDYNKACGIDINKTHVSRTGGARPRGDALLGHFEEGVVVRDNRVYNHGHRGFNVSGRWVTLRDNVNERDVLREFEDPYGIGGWELTLDGYLQSAPGGSGAISDNLSRAFDLGGQGLWVHANRFGALGSDPGNDGEGILCQAHGGTHIYDWAVTRNVHRIEDGEPGYVGAWNVEVHGALFAWNRTAGWAGAVLLPRPATDFAVVANEAAGGTRAPPAALTADPPGDPAAPRAVRAVPRSDAVDVRWKDGGEGEVGFRVERRVEDGPWTAIAYRPPRIEDRKAPLRWLDVLAPPERALRYRVVAVDADDRGPASEPSDPAVLARP